jgi:hypothetical protein
MVAKQLAELKDQIKELLEKGYIRPTSPLWGPYKFSSQRRMVLNVCACIIVLRLRLLSRTSTLPRIDDLFDQLHGVCVCVL